MAEQELSNSQALGYIRRGVQTLRFLDRLEASARLILDNETHMNALEMAVTEKRLELAKLEAQLQAGTEQLAVEAEAHKVELAQRRTAHAEALDGLNRDLEERQQATATAMANEERAYLQQAREHEAKIVGLQATIAEREGYLQGLERRIGELRASFEGVR